MRESERNILDSLGGNCDELLGEVRVVDGKSDGGDEGEPLISLLVVDETSRVSKGDRVGHVNLEYQLLPFPWRRILTVMA